MIASHASPACQVGIAHHWESALGSDGEIRRRAEDTLDAIRDGRFAEHLVDEQSHGYPELRTWRARRSKNLEETERHLHARLGSPPGSLAKEMTEQS